MNQAATAKQEIITGLTESQVKNLADFIELYFIESIQNDRDIDNIHYVVDMMNAFQKLRYTQQIMQESNPAPEEGPYLDLMISTTDAKDLDRRML